MAATPGSSRRRRRIAHRRSRARHVKRDRAPALIASSRCPTARAAPGRRSRAARWCRPRARRRNRAGHPPDAQPPGSSAGSVADALALYRWRVDDALDAGQRRIEVAPPRSSRAPVLLFSGNRIAIDGRLQPDERKLPDRSGRPPFRRSARVDDEGVRARGHARRCRARRSAGAAAARRSRSRRRDALAPDDRCKRDAVAFGRTVGGSALRPRDDRLLGNRRRTGTVRSSADAGRDVPAGSRAAL